MQLEAAQSLAIGVLSLLLFIVNMWALINLLRRPSWAFQSAHVSRGLWMALIILAIVLCNSGFFLSIFYIFVIDPKVRNQETLGHGPGFPTGTGNFPT